jgi:hypothetical protein
MKWIATRLAIVGCGFLTGANLFVLGCAAARMVEIQVNGAGFIALFIGALFFGFSVSVWLATELTSKEQHHG